MLTSVTKSFPLYALGSFVASSLLSAHHLFDHTAQTHLISESSKSISSGT